MEPLGTVTMYFPFIDADIKDVIQSIMDEATDFDDFVQRLSERVLSSDYPEMVVYFTIHFAALLYNYKIIEAIREKYSGYLLLDPALNLYSSFPEAMKKVRESADVVLKTKPADWLVLEMHCYKFEADMNDYPKTMYEQEDVDIIREYIKKDPRFRYYEITLNDHLGHRAYTDGDFEELLDCLDRGIQITEEFDDRVRLSSFLYKKAKFISSSDRKQAQELLRKAYDLNESLNCERNYAGIIYEMGVLNAIRGEFDEAITSFLQEITIRERIGKDTGNSALQLSMLYNIIGEPESGLEWGLMAADQFESRPHLIPRGIMNQAWSLILLGRFTEAEILLDTTRETIMKSGNEVMLAWLHFVTGIFEFGSGNLSSAKSSIEEALKIYENRVGTLMIQIIFLYYLARIEVASCEIDSTVFPFLALLEEKAISEDLPGVLGLVLILRGEIAAIQNDESSLRDIIQELRPFTEKQGMQYLLPFYNSLLSRI